MSPTEHIWVFVDRRLARDVRPVAETSERWVRTEAICNSFPQIQIKNLFDSMLYRSTYYRAWWLYQNLIFDMLCFFVVVLFCKFNHLSVLIQVVCILNVIQF